MCVCVSVSECVCVRVEHAVRVWWVLSRGSRSLTVLCDLCAHGLCGLHVLYIMRASCSFGSNIATKFGGAKILMLKQGHNGGAKRGVKDECQEEDSQMPAECQEKDSQMPAEKGNGSLRRCLHLLIPFTWAVVRAVLRLQTYLLILDFLLLSLFVQNTCLRSTQPRSCYAPAQKGRKHTSGACVSGQWLLELCSRRQGCERCRDCIRLQICFSGQCNTR